MRPTVTRASGIAVRSSRAARTDLREHLAGEARRATIGRIECLERMLMTAQQIAAAMRRVEGALQRRPDVGMHAEAPASARWEGGTRIVASHANGKEMATDMPSELGGSGNEVTPGWLFRAGFASCAATCIAMGAAALGIELASLEVVAKSRSDLRGLLGMTDTDGARVNAGPRDVELVVRIAAAGVSPERLRALVQESYRCSPISNAVASGVPVALSIEIDSE